MTHEEITLKIKEELKSYLDGSDMHNIPLEYKWEELPDNQVQEILNAKEPEKEFNEIKLDILENNWDDFVYDNGKDTVMFLLSSELVKEMKTSGYDLDDFIDKYVYFTAVDHDLVNQAVKVDIVLDTGDKNTDFTQNIFANGYYHSADEYDSPDQLPKYSSLVWLAEQQGLSREELFKVFKDESLMSEKFVGLRSEKEQLTDTLEAMGKHRYNPYYNNGAYARYMSIKSDLDRIDNKINIINEAIAKNSVSFEEFKKKHPTNQSVQSLKEVDFYKKKAAVLESNSKGLNECVVKKTEILQTILSDKNLMAVSFAEERYNKVLEEMDEMTNSTPELAAKEVLARSIIQESENTTTHMNALTFFVKMPLKQAMEINRIIKAEEAVNNSYYPDERKGESTITLSKDCFVGLYDPWAGAGSVLDIQLAKDVEIPIKYIFSASVGDRIGYSVESIFGDLDYTEALVGIKEVPVKTLENMLSDAASRAGKSPEEGNKNKDKTLKERN